MKYWKSLITNNIYPKDDLDGKKYTNHGWGGIKQGYHDLPTDEYPYTIIEIKQTTETDLK